MNVELALGSIVDSCADAIVNAANPQLMPGGGVCGAIHAAAGPELARACADWVREHGPVAEGSAVITPGFRLAARWVIHAVGPVWHGGSHGEPRTLASAYAASVALADATPGVVTLAFPSISTGIYGYPVDEAAPVAIAAVLDALTCASRVRSVTFALFDASTYDAYGRALDRLGDK